VRHSAIPDTPTNQKITTHPAPKQHPHQFLPTLYVLVGTIASVALQSFTSIAFLLLAPYCAWVYLRFVQWQPETTLRGDPSDDFRFSTFFPDAVQVGGRWSSCVMGWLGWGGFIFCWSLWQVSQS